MTSKDFIRAEAENTDRIILYREGLFWKAYERSAFAVCTQIRPFKPTKRSLKTLDGGELISIGFPSSTEERVLDGLTRLETEPDRLVLASCRPVVVAEFETWKASVPLALPRSKSKAGDDSAVSSTCMCATAPESAGAAVTCDGVPAMQEQKTLIGLPAAAAQAQPDFTLSTACVVAERVRGFDLASSTPMECMFFISDLKKMLITADGSGSIRQPSGI